MNDKTRVLAVMGVTLASALLGGCISGHYVVTDLNTGTTYKTNRVERLDNGAIMFRSYGSGTVTIQNSSVQRVYEDD